uniref:Uncharacterized protein n=1 Tax=Pygocentrus nattereri TaxID=42514 RepID=A0A3B4EBS6_PYGNA
ILLQLLPFGILPAFEPLELSQGGHQRPVQQVLRGFGLVCFGQQSGVAAQRHSFVFYLVPVDPGQHSGQRGVRSTVGDPVQQVQVTRLLFGSIKVPEIKPSRWISWRNPRVQLYCLL